jgi:hypothetical protein
MIAAIYHVDRSYLLSSPPLSHAQIPHLSFVVCPRPPGINPKRYIKRSHIRPSLLCLTWLWQAYSFIHSLAPKTAAYLAANQTFNPRVESSWSPLPTMRCHH